MIPTYPDADDRERAIDLVYAVGGALGVPVRTIPIEVFERAVTAALDGITNTNTTTDELETACPHGVVDPIWCEDCAPIEEAR
jgi:hypothetical protein